MKYCKAKQQKLIIFSLIFSGLLSAQAFTVTQRSQDEVIRASDLIVHGTVMQTQTHSTEQGVYTLSTIRIHSAFKGQSSHTLHIYQSGGTYKGLSQRIIGQDLLKEGEEWILFLSSLPNTERMKQVLKKNNLTSSLYRILSGPFASIEISTDEQGHKLVRLGKAAPSRPNLSKKTSKLKLVKVHSTPKLQLKAPIAILAPSIKKSKDLSSSQARPSPTQSTKSTKLHQRLNHYIDELKTAIDRSLAPKTPTH